MEVLEDFDDWLLDVPDGVAVMTNFICRAITDEVLPPSFVARITPPANSSLAQLRDKCATTMAQPHSAERLLRCWGAGAPPHIAISEYTIPNNTSFSPSSCGVLYTEITADIVETRRIVVACRSG